MDIDRSPCRVLTSIDIFYDQHDILLTWGVKTLSIDWHACSQRTWPTREIPGISFMARRIDILAGGGIQVQWCADADIGIQFHFGYDIADVHLYGVPIRRAATWLIPDLQDDLIVTSL